MPTSFTETVGKLRYAILLRKNILQRAALYMPASWESVPVMEYIRQHPGCMQADIAKSLKVTASAVTLSTQRLENAGLILKKTDRKNLRRNQIYITPEGEKMIKRGSEIYDETDKVMFKDVAEGDLAFLNKILDKINANMEKFKKPDFSEKCLPWEFTQ